MPPTVEVATAETEFKENEWNEQVCDCMAGAAMEPWRSDPTLWNDPMGPLEIAGCDCCSVTAKLYESEGMLEDGTLPCKVSRSCCCALVFTCYLAQNAGLPVLPIYMMKLRSKVGDRLGIQRESCCKDFFYAFMTGPYVFAIQRELILRGQCLRVKPKPEAAAPAQEEIERT